MMNKKIAERLLPVKKHFVLQEKNIYLWSIFVLFITSIFSVGAYHYDEHFQILEFAGLQLGLTTAENLPWEFHYQMRQTLQPFMVIALHKFWETFGITSPFFITFILRLFSAAFAFGATYFLYHSLKDEIQEPLFKKWFLLLAFLSWYGVFISVRFSQENWGGIFLVFAFVFYNHFLVKAKTKNNTKMQNKMFLKYFIVGILLGFSFVFRYQLAFALLGFGLWMLLIQKEKITCLMIFFLGFLLTFALSILLDSIFYGKFTVTIWNYFDQNIIHDKAANFGEDPWWWYIPTSIVKAAPVSLLFWPALLIMVIAKRKHLIIWLIVPFIIGHMLVGHKEIRFLFPIVFFIPFVLVKSFSVVQEQYTGFASSLALKGFMNFVFIVNFILVAVMMFKPANPQITIQREIYRAASKTFAELYYQNNPYENVAVVTYYRPKNLQLRPLQSLDTISSIAPNKGKQLLVTQKSVITNSKPFEHGKLLYTSFPKWVVQHAKQYNFFGWANRTPMYELYEFNALTKPTKN